MIYIYRRISNTIKQIADVMPVVIVTGARQVGKSTMLQKEFSSYDYVTLDDYALMEQARLDPQSLWAGKLWVNPPESRFPPTFRLCGRKIFGLNWWLRRI